MLSKPNWTIFPTVQIYMRKKLQSTNEGSLGKGVQQRGRTQLKLTCISIYCKPGRGKDVEAGKEELR